ncbi:MAG: CobW family GTP-binding protein [Pseudomonas sp.]
MLQNIPTHVIAGPLGAGKTSLIKHLLAQKPAGERWAILINEFGQIGLDAALLTTAHDGIALGEVAGGCLCCVNGAPFQVGLGRLLRKARPDRLLIEPSGLGHPAQLLEQLRDPPWEGVLAVQPSVLVLDAMAMAAGQPLPESQQLALSGAGLLVMNKSERVDLEARNRIAQRLPDRPLYWTEQAALPLSELPGRDAQASDPLGNLPVDNPLPPKGLAQMPAIWTDPRQPICLSQGQAEGWSIGWRWHPSQQLELMRVQQWLNSLEWRRAKLVIHSNAGWLSGNALDGAAIHWQNSEWRRDSRLELIFAEPQDEDLLKSGLAACVL